MQQQSKQVGPGLETQNPIAKLYNKYKMLSESISAKPVSTSSDEFILYASKFMKKLTEVGIADRETMLLVGLSHYLDMLSLEEIKQIANQERRPQTDDNAEFERVLHAYIEQYSFTCSSSKSSSKVMIGTTDSLTSWADASDNKVKLRSEDTLHEYVKRMLGSKVDFIERTHNAKPGKWKTSSTEIADPTLSTLRACVSNWVLSSLNLPLVRSTGKDTVYDGVPYKVGCLRWSSAKSEHEFILVDLKIQKSVIHGQVPTKKPEVALLLQSILGSKGHSLETFVKEKERGIQKEKEEGEPEGIKNAKGDIKESIQGLIVFTELLLRVLDIQDKQKMDGSGHRWMLRPCELQLVTKVGSMYHANKTQQPK